MRIEILTRKTDLKSRVLTWLSRENSLVATGEKATIPGLELQIAADYLLFNITSFELAEKVVPMLFSVTQVSTAGQLYEPDTDMKIIVTARSYDPALLLPHMHEVSHLDLERGELLGTRLTEWRSRNVSVTARSELAVQGNVLVARIKFSTHSRDSLFNCSGCVALVSLRSILEPLCPGLEKPLPKPQVQGPLVQAEFKTSGEKWAEFINQRFAPVEFCGETNQYKIVFSNTGFISFRQEPGKEEILCRVELPDPAVFNGELSDALRNMGLSTATVTAQVENIILSPHQLINEMNFKKEKDFYLFTRENEFFKARYHVKNLELVLEREIRFDTEFNPRLLQDIFQGMRDFLNRVI